MNTRKHNRPLSADELVNLFARFHPIKRKLYFVENAVCLALVGSGVAPMTCMILVGVGGASKATASSVGLVAYCLLVGVLIITYRKAQATLKLQLCEWERQRPLAALIRQADYISSDNVKRIVVDITDRGCEGVFAKKADTRTYVHEVAEILWMANEFCRMESEFERDGNIQERFEKILNQR
jgi:hypothetical protein